MIVMTFIYLPFFLFTHNCKFVTSKYSKYELHKAEKTGVEKKI